MDHKYMTISELAKLRKTTTSTLRYYDRIGLLKPDYVDPDTGYRYYSIFQYEKLGTILELRSLEMPIDQIVEYFCDRNLKQSIDILETYQKRLEEKINMQKSINDVLKSKLQFLNTLHELGPLETVFLSEFAERSIITFGKPSGDPEKHAYAYTKLEWYIDEVAPILATDRIGVYVDEAILEDNEEFVPAIPMIIVQKTGENKKYIQTIPAGKYACMYYSNGRLEHYHPSFEIIKKYLRDNSYEICGPILQIYKIDVTLTNDRSETIIELQIPITEKK